MDFSNQKRDIRLIGQGGNTKVYLLDSEYKGYSSAVIKQPLWFVDRKVDTMVKNHGLLMKHGIKTTQFLEECTFDGGRAVITENLHHDDYTCLDANAHLLTEQDRLLERLGPDYCIRSNNTKEPEEERKFADRRFKKIINLEEFARNHLNELRRISNVRIYLSYDCYFFKVKSVEVTDIDYVIADWDDIEVFDEPDLYIINQKQFEVALMQFLKRYVEEGKAKEYENVIRRFEDIV